MVNSKSYIVNGLVLLIVTLSCSCANPGGDPSRSLPLEADTVAAALMQGVWVDEDTGIHKLRVKGDSIYFSSQVNAPMLFKVFADTLVVYGAESAKYPIFKLTSESFSFYTTTGDLMSLLKSDSDSLLYGTTIPTVAPAHEVQEKDSIIFSQGERYRGYVYINSTDIKVTSPYLTEDGLYMDNVFFDNVIHICVYRGKERLFGKDIRREMFEGIVPNEYLQFSILEDMNFVGVSPRGYIYSATICSPGSPSCYCVEVFVSKEGELTFTLVD